MEHDNQRDTGGHDSAKETGTALEQQEQQQQPGNAVASVSASSSTKLSEELFVFTAQKAGMQQVNKDHVNRVVYDMSKDSLFFQNSIKKNEKVDERIERMKDQMAKLTRTQEHQLQQRVDRLLIDLEAQRDLTRIRVVVDMDMFYAAVEMRDNPKLREVPLAVGGMSMISTTNYIARQFGVRAAMPGFIGKELCPDLVFVPVNFTKYKSVANEIQEIFALYDPHFSAHSLDEAYLDITAYMRENWMQYAASYGRATPESDEEDHMDVPCLPKAELAEVAAAIVAELRQRVFEKTQLTCSAGIAVNSMLAKICSDMNKPNGQYLLPFDRESIINFVEELPVRKIGGIGKVMEKILTALGICNMKRVYEERVRLFHVFSEKTATWLLRASRGIQEFREASERKSYSRETTFRRVSDEGLLLRICRELCEQLAVDLSSSCQGGKTITLKLKCIDFSVRTRSASSASVLYIADEIYAMAVELLRVELPLELRLMGVRVSALCTVQSSTGGSTGRPKQLRIRQFAASLSSGGKEEDLIEQLLELERGQPESVGVLAAPSQTMSRKRKAPLIELVQGDRIDRHGNNSRAHHPQSSFQPCPICGKDINIGNLIAVNQHIDQCIDSQRGTKSAKAQQQTITAFLDTANGRK